MKNSKKFLLKFMWSLIWIFIYSFLYISLIFLLKEIFGNFKFFNIKILSLLILGLFFSLFSRIIYSLINNNKIKIRIDIIYWAFGYALAIWIAEFVITLITKKFELIIGFFMEVIVVGLIIYLLIELFKKMDFGRRNKFHGKFHLSYLSFILIPIFLFFSYKYYQNQVVDAFFTTLIQLPFIQKVVEGWVYWVIIIAICGAIWWVFQTIDGR